MSLRLFSFVAALVLALITLSALLNPQRIAGANPVSLACPNGRTVLLEGTGPPRTALLIILDGRPVGGGSTTAAGTYRLPLTLRERPGIYPVEVRTRAERVVVGSFTCYVDVPVDVAPTPTPEIVVTAAPPGSGPTATPSSATPTPSPAQPGATTPTATPRTSAPVGTSTATATASPTGEAANTAVVEIIGVTLREASQATNPRAEFVTISNDDDAAVNLQGWQLINTSSVNQLTYTFPAFEMDSGLAIVVYSGTGANDPEQGEFYWGLSGNVWNVGDVAELRDRNGQVISRYTVGT